jgi:hypothetical protein
MALPSLCPLGHRNNSVRGVHREEQPLVFLEQGAINNAVNLKGFHLVSPSNLHCTMPPADSMYSTPPSTVLGTAVKVACFFFFDFDGMILHQTNLLSHLTQSRLGYWLGRLATGLAAG